MTTSSPSVSYGLRVNGTEHTVEEGWLGESLLYVLRERLGFPGAKAGCEQGECGSCSVIVEGTLVCACLVLAAAAVGVLALLFADGWLSLPEGNRGTAPPKAVVDCVAGLPTATSGLPASATENTCNAGTPTPTPDPMLGSLTICTVLVASRGTPTK